MAWRFYFPPRKYDFKINVTYFRDTALSRAVGWGCVLVATADIVDPKLSVFPIMPGNSNSPLSCVALQPQRNVHGNGFIVCTTSTRLCAVSAFVGLDMSKEEMRTTSPAE